MRGCVWTCRPHASEPVRANGIVLERTHCAVCTQRTGNRYANARSRRQPTEPKVACASHIR
eukprot:1952792-Prymnesium_polylepis.1